MATGKSLRKLNHQRQKREQRIRYTLKQSGHLRLCVSRSSRHIYAQIIDDQKQHTLVAASTQDESLKLKKTGSREAASQVGKMIAERAAAAGVKKVVFDRGTWLYHGRIQALAEAARENGLEF